MLQYHKTLISEFTGYVTLYGNDLGNWKDVKARTCAMCMILHMADISNVARDFSLARQWATRIIQGECAGHLQGPLLLLVLVHVGIKLADRVCGEQERQSVVLGILSCVHSARAFGRAVWYRPIVVCAGVPKQT